LDIVELRKKIAEINIEANKIRILYDSATPIIEQISLMEKSADQDIKELDFLYLKLQEIIEKAQVFEVEQGEILMLGPTIDRLKVLE
jgi:hypothetical protein